MVYFTYACKLVIPWSASLSLFNLLLAFLTVLLWDVIHMTCYLHKRHEEWHVVLLIVQWMRWRYLVYLLGALSVQKMFTVLSRIYIYTEAIVKFGTKYLSSVLSRITTVSTECWLFGLGACCWRLTGQLFRKNILIFEQYGVCMNFPNKLFTLTQLF